MEFAGASISVSVTGNTHNETRNLTYYAGSQKIGDILQSALLEHLKGQIIPDKQINPKDYKYAITYTPVGASSAVTKPFSIDYRAFKIVIFNNFLKHFVVFFMFLFGSLNLEG